MKDESQRERLGTVLHVAAQCVLDCNTILAPFLPFSANAVWTTSSAARASSCRCRGSSTSRTSTPTTAPGLHVYPIITGDYSAHAALGEPAGHGRARRSSKPTPVFTKLDPAVVDEELARLGGS